MASSTGAHVGRSPVSAWSRVQAKLRLDEHTGCLVFMGARNRGGYGITHVLTPAVKYTGAHRVAYEAAHGEIPEGLHLDHLCRNRACCNPDHLEAVPKRVNTLRGNGPAAVNARKTHCKWGHEFTPENTIWRSYGGRDCRVCKHENSLARSRGGRAAMANGDVR